MSPNSILIIDDDAAILEMLREFLWSEGYDAIPVSMGSAAVARAIASPPGLILLDLMMPEMSGWQVIAALRAAPETRSVPVILLSARRDLAAAAHDLDVVTYLEKPFELDELLALVARYVEPTTRDDNPRASAPR